MSRMWAALHWELTAPTNHNQAKHTNTEHTPVNQGTNHSSERHAYSMRLDSLSRFPPPNAARFRDMHQFFSGRSSHL